MLIGLRLQLAYQYCRTRTTVLSCILYDKGSNTVRAPTVFETERVNEARELCC